jgi:hypothetical protein
MSKKTSRRVSVPLDCLVRLWDFRADALDKREAVIVINKPLKDQLSAMASAYRQCARELEKPPMALFKELGYQPNDGGEGREV